MCLTQKRGDKVSWRIYIWNGAIKLSVERAMELMVILKEKSVKNYINLRNNCFWKQRGSVRNRSPYTPVPIKFSLKK